MIENLGDEILPADTEFVTAESEDIGFLRKGRLTKFAFDTITRFVNSQIPEGASLIHFEYATQVDRSGSSHQVLQSIKVIPNEKYPDITPASVIELLDNLTMSLGKSDNGIYNLAQINAIVAEIPMQHRSATRDIADASFRSV